MNTAHDICFNETRITKIEQQQETRNEFLQEARTDLKQTIEQVNTISLQLAELNKTIMLREDAFIQINSMKNELVSVHSTLRTLKWLTPILCTLLTIVITLASLALTHLK